MLCRRKLILSAAAGICSPAIVKAQNLMLLRSGSVAPVSAASGLVFTQTDSAFAEDTGNPITYTSKNIGTAASNRVVIVILSCVGTLPSGLTVGGTALTQIAQQNGPNTVVTIYSKTVAAGTTANIVASFGGTAFNANIIVGKTNTSTETPVDAQNAGLFASGPSKSITFTVPTNGVGVVAGQAGTAGTTISWTNATQDVSGGSFLMGEAQTSVVGSDTVTLNLTPNDTCMMAAASWGP